MASPQLPAVFEDEARGILAALPDDVSCVATGSIVEGLGNPHSDIDLYVITGDALPGQITAMGIRKSRYVDCEYMKLATLAALRDRILGSDWAALEDLRLREIDRFYRLAVSVPVRVSDGVASVLSGFSKSVGCSMFLRFAALRAHEHMAEAACALAAGSAAEAGLLLREGALWHAAQRLAEAGEGYPSLKWTGEKAARLYGRSAPEFRDLTDDYLHPAGTLAVRLERLRSRLDTPPELARLLDARSARLAQTARLLTGSGETYLMEPPASVVRVTGLAAAACRQLASGRSWGDAMADIAHEMGVPPREVSTAAWRETHDLRAHEFLVRQ